MEIVEFETEDVITTSADELPFVPYVPNENVQLGKWLIPDKNTAKENMAEVFSYIEKM